MPNAEESRRETVYEYRDEDGTLLYQAVRREPGSDGRSKDFVQRRPMPDGKWKYDLQGVRRVPYRLAELTNQLKQGSGSIVLVEGEKDVETLANLGVVATAFAGGTGGWKDDYTEWFFGADIVIIPDNDTPGKNYAAKMVSALKYVTKRLRWLELPDLEEHGDITDWVEKGHGLPELLELAKGLPNLVATLSADDEVPSEDRPSQVRPVNWVELWDAEMPDAEWLAEPFLAKGRQHALYAEPKLGKSLVALDVTMALATGRPILGGEAKDPVVVVYIDQEMTDSDLRERAEDLGYGPDYNELLTTNLFYYQVQQFPPFDTKEGGAMLADLAISHGAELVVIDTMAAVIAGDENDANTYQNFYQFAGVPLKRAGITLLRIDHMGKDPTRGQRGSSQKAGDIDIVMRLLQVDDKLVLRCTHKRVPWIPSETFIERRVTPTLAHIVSNAGYPEGVKDCADWLDELLIPEDATHRTASKALRAIGKGKSSTVVNAALKFRRMRNAMRHRDDEPPEQQEELL